MKLSKSPERFSFHKERYIERQAAKGRTVDNDEDVKAMVDYFENSRSLKEDTEKDDEWKKNNLEYDLRTTDWILEKTRSSESYAQNLYAAMCNNDFVKNEIWPILTENKWSCSWRYAGGIIADMRQEGDYIDWYCSGIRGGVDLGLDRELTEEQKVKLEVVKKFVSESVITEEIREDLLKLGWIVITDEENQV